jgi:uncharacterized protein YbbC (DUF1343 family)
MPARTRFARLLPLHLVALLIVCCATRPALDRSARIDRTFDRTALNQIDSTIERSVASHQIPGGVFWVERDGVAYHRAYGSRSLEPVREAMTEETIFDAASLTKVVATAPSIFLLMQRGKIALDAPARTYLPEFRGGLRDEVTIRHLLTHTSGLRPDVDLTSAWHGHATGIALALAEEPRNRPGFIFRYSDINFILLGEIVERISGLPLDQFAARELYTPLHMDDTRFLRSDVRRAATLLARIAPTERVEGVILRGDVHDPTARRMDGVAGHAGLFTTARDLAAYARMFVRPAAMPSCVMNESGVATRGSAPCRPLDEATIRQMTSVLSPANVAVRRGGGWDIDSSFSRPRGDLFPLGSFGHTGYTGTMLWIDPSSSTFWIFLSNRVHPNGHGNVLPLQRELGTLAGKAIRDFDFTHVTSLPPRAGGAVHWVMGGANAMNGIDVLEGNRYRELQQLRIGLITNHTGIDRYGNPTIDVLRSAPGVNVVALFSPEHGIRGQADERIDDSVDAASGLPVYSLYGQRKQPSAEQLAQVDALVFDIQDVGTRFYTYISTMGLAMESAAAAHKKFIVLDRVDPIGGSDVEGALSEGEPSFTAFHPLPIRYGMTIGELAGLYRDERHLDVDLHVVRIDGWRREQWQDEAGLPWIDTSPNMRSLNAAALYPGIGLLESALSVGRGTATPFELLGAPYIDGAELARELNASMLPGVTFQPLRFVPAASTFKGEECGGVRITITDRHALQPVRTGLTIAVALRRRYGDAFALDKVAPLLRNAAVLDSIREGKLPAETRNPQFELRRAPHLLYQ